MDLASSPRCSLQSSLTINKRVGSLVHLFNTPKKSDEQTDIANQETANRTMSFFCLDQHTHVCKSLSFDEIRSGFTY